MERTIHLALSVLLIATFSIFVTSQQNSKSTETPWNNPCSPQEITAEERSSKITKEAEKNAYNRVISQAKVALEALSPVAKSWCHFTLHNDFKKQLKRWRFLPPGNYLPNSKEIKKTAGSKLSNVSPYKWEDMVRDMYLWLQKVILGMDQLVKNQIDGNEPLGERFADVYTEFMLLLCQLDVTIALLRIEKKADPSPTLMIPAERNPPFFNTRTIRDFHILRETQNIGEYIEQAFSAHIDKL